MLGAGDGSLYLYKYHYPDQRKVKVRDLDLDSTFLISVKSQSCMEIHALLHYCFVYQQPCTYR